MLPSEKTHQRAAKRLRSEHSEKPADASEAVVRRESNAASFSSSSPTPPLHAPTRSPSQRERRPTKRLAESEEEEEESESMSHASPHALAAVHSTPHAAASTSESAPDANNEADAAGAMLVHDWHYVSVQSHDGK